MTGASGIHPQCPTVLGLFQKRIDGDDSLLRLAALRFKEAGLGAEFYAESPSELDLLLRFRPSPGTPAVVHLGRGLNVFEEAGRRVIIEFAQVFQDRISGIVIHDQAEIAERFNEYLVVLRELESAFDKIEGCPPIFIEYAVGLDPELFISLFKEVRGLKHVSACIDIGHIGLRQAGKTYARYRPGEDIFAINTNTPHLTEAVEDLQRAVSAAPGAVVNMIQELGSLAKPLHFHLHDAHPLSRVSPFGISDHLSFLDKVPIPFEYKGRRYLDPMFGPDGLSKIVREALRLPRPELLSFSLEIHPTKGKLPLGNASYLFSHWQDRGNAERMNLWLSVLNKNQKLVLKACNRRR
jgi:hypothetical protein